MNDTNLIESTFNVNSDYLPYSRLEILVADNDLEIVEIEGGGDDYRFRHDYDLADGVVSVTVRGTEMDITNFTSDGQNIIAESTIC